MTEMLHTEKLADRTRAIMEPAFAREVIYPLLHRKGTGQQPPRAMEASLVQDRGTGRVTVRYRFAGEVVMFGKLYSDGLGRHGYQVTRRLWTEGFGPQGPHRVPQPRAYLSRYDLFLMRAVAAPSLEAFTGLEGAELTARVREAARWLVHLHRSPLRIGEPERLWQSSRLTMVLHRLAKAADRAPRQRKELTDMVDTLLQQGWQARSRVASVQTHGSFHSEHIFVHDGAVTVIDFDRSRPSDPARDLAEFLSMLRHRTFKLTGSIAAAEAPTAAFLDEYLGQLPEHGANLRLHWGAYLLENLFRYVCRRENRRERGEEEERARYERRVSFLAEEFAQVLVGRLCPGSMEGR